jgi:hypothetical protein
MSVAKLPACLDGHGTKVQLASPACLYWRSWLHRGLPLPLLGTALQSLKAYRMLPLDSSSAPGNSEVEGAHVVTGDPGDIPWQCYN